MAEIDMDIDSFTKPVMETEADDDLIDYDDELVGRDEGEPVQTLGAATESLVENGAPLGAGAAEATDHGLGLVLDGHEEPNDHQNNGSDENPNGVDNLHEAFSGQVNNEAGEGSHEDFLLDTDQEPQYDAGEKTSDAHHEPREDVHEVDLSYEEDPETQDAHIQGADAETPGGAEVGDHQYYEQEEEEQAASARVGDDPVVQVGHEAERPATDITEQDGEHNADNVETLDATHPDTIGEDEITWEDDEKVEEPQPTQDDPHQDAEHDAVVQGDTELGGPDGFVIEAEAEAEHMTSATHTESHNTGEAEFPAITVQYRGDEFPLFSLSSEGFFTEVSALDDDIEALLAGFRSELENEIASEEELVFQVDELGLEYAESSTRDSLSHITLRQILEIFDLLVKNQDPDSSRTLYTYLFTKPSTSKRFDSLVESAAAGKGLDEVMHLFESPMPHNTNLAEVVDTTGSYHDLDEYESAGDVSAVGYAENTEADDGSNYHDGQDNPHARHDETGEDDEKETDEQEQGSNEDHAQGEPGQLEEETSVDAMIQPAASLTGNATANNQSNDISAAEIDNLAEDSDFDIDEGFPTYNQLEHDAGPATAGTSTTNTTNTVNNNETALEAPAGAEVDAVEDEPNQADDAEVDEFAEIDWREDPAEEESPSSASQGAVKRARAEDELDVADEKDVKRQRS